MAIKRDMNKTNFVRLTENDLNRLVENSVRNVLRKRVNEDMRTPMTQQDYDNVGTSPLSREVFQGAMKQIDDKLNRIIRFLQQMGNGGTRSYNSGVTNTPQTNSVV